MIEDIITHTQVNSQVPSLFNFNVDLSILEKLNYDKNILTRESFRYFDGKRSLSSADDIIELCNFLNEVISSIFRYPDIVEIGVVDNKGIFGHKKPSILVYRNHNLAPISISSDIGRDNLYIQEEMHDCDGVVFFLWDLSKIPNNYIEHGRFYKEIIMMSGFLGQLTSEYAENLSWKGTVFAGLMEADWNAIVNKKDALKKPIFAYAFQK